MNAETMELVADFTETEMLEFYDYLDNLRESGVTNMFGAPKYLQEEFEISFDQACNITTSWMHTFTARQKGKSE